MIDAMNTAVAGMQTASRTVERGASNLANPDKQGDIIKDIVDIKLAETAYKANAAVIRTASDMQDELLKSLDVTV